MTERWKQRFENFEKAYKLLKEVVDMGLSTLSDLEQAGTVQRFEFTFELAWKLMKDYMVFQGVDVDTSFPREIIKEAFQSGLIRNDAPWNLMLKDRNILSHRYDETSFHEALMRIETVHFVEISHFYTYLKGQAS